MLLPRRPELAVLTQALAASAATGGRVLLLRGEAGVGKTTLVSQFLASMDPSARAFVGYCDNLRAPQPFGPLWDMREKDANLCDALAKSEHRAVVDALLALMSSACGHEALIVVEDTQWVDEATLDALTAVGRRIIQTDALLLLTYRDAEVNYDHPVRSLIGAIPPDRIERMTLRPLTLGQVQQIVGDRLDDMGRLMELSNGNPLLVEEIAAVGFGSVPLSIEDRVAARFTVLSPAARRLLEGVSVVPGGLQSELLSTVGLQDAQSLSEARTTGWLEVESGRVSYRHEVIRQAVEAMLSDTVRTELNRRVAEALIGVDAAPALIAYHAEEARMADTLLEYGRRAGEAATAAGSHREALAHYRSLGPYLEDVDVDSRVDILAKWANSAFHNDDPTAVELQEHAIALHRELSDVSALVQSLAAAVRLYQSNGRPDDARLAADEAVATASSGLARAERSYALGQSAWLALIHGQRRQALQRAQQAIELADADDNPSVLVQAMTTKGSALLPEDEGVELLQRASEVAAAHGLWFEHGRALINMAQQGLVDMTRLDEAERLARQAVQVGEQYELESLRTFSTSQLATMLFHKGGWDEASELSYSVLGTNRQSDAPALTRLGAIHARTGNTQAESTLERAWEVSEELGEVGHVSAVSATWAEFCWITGRAGDPRLDRCVEVMMQSSSEALITSANRIAAWLYQVDSSRAWNGRRENVHELAHREFDLWMKGNAPYDRAVAQIVLKGGDELASLETLETMGAAPVAAKYRQQLRAAGYSVPRGRARQTRAHPAGLTARQAEVLELLADELTNAQIADTLFLSLRTVEKHVSAVLGKLDAASRAEAVAEANERGLLKGTNAPK